MIAKLVISGVCSEGHKRNAAKINEIIDVVNTIKDVKEPTTEPTALGLGSEIRKMETKYLKPHKGKK